MEGGNARACVLFWRHKLTPNFMQSALTEKQRQLRARSVGNALASLRIEALKPSERLLELTQQFIEGSIGTAEMLEDLKRRHAAVQRG